MSILTPEVHSDADIQQDVLEELSRDRYLTVSDIGVSVKEGVVTLTGLVESYLARMAAQNAALRVAGVNAVANEIEVRLHTAQSTDSDLALAAFYALKWDAVIQPDKLDITVSHGSVTLKGVVEWPFQREAAERAIRRLVGIKSVRNWITVANSPTPDDISQRIATALAQSDETGALPISVEVHGNDATLKGTVRSFTEKHAAERAALSAPGILSVTNQIEVVYEP